MAESVELATILLTDLVGSTRLATAVGPVRADQLREEHFDLLRDAIASSAGKEVKNTGDGLMVAFPSASEAVRCAVAIQQRFERRYRDAEQVLHIRVALAAGESTVKDGDYFGLPSIEAARLCEQAPVDGILVSALAKALAGRCEGVEFRPAGELELKGFAEPVQAFAVSWLPLGEEVGGASRWPLPALLRSVPAVSYVGRTEERAAIEESMTLARERQRQLVLLCGEPGIGKTRLSSYAAHHAHAEGFAVLWGSCSEELAVPYEPWIEICSHAVEHAPDELLVRHVERQGGELGRLVRGLHRRVPELPAPQSSDPETERYLLFGAVTGLLDELVAMVPLCVVLDDLHWADAQSLALLKHLLRTLQQGSLHVIATYRDSDLGKDHPLTAVQADLRSLRGVQRISLQGLGADEVAELMAVVAGHELGADGARLAAQMAQETDGNPFFVGEILRGLSESGALRVDEATGHLNIDGSSHIALPESVREVIERRVERLEHEAAEILRLAAVVGRSFDLELMTAITEIDESALLDHLEAAVSASLLAESSDGVGRFRFVHALINQTLYEGLGATRRARMHHRVAEALERLYGADPGERAAELALHWRLAADAAARPKAAAYALRAGERALNDLAPAEAMRQFRDALELAGDADRRMRCEALIGLGEAERQGGDAGYRERLLEASRLASALADAQLAATAALANNRGYASLVGGVDAERIGAIERALALDDPPDPARRARLLALQAQELSWDPDFARRRGLAEESIALARGTGHTEGLAAVLNSASFALWAPETLGLRLSLAEELAACAAELRDRAVEVSAQGIAVDVFAELGEFSQAQTALEGLRVSATELGQPTPRWFATYVSAGWEFLHGRLTSAERLAEQAFQIGLEAGQPDAALVRGTQLAFVRVHQGRGEEIIETLERGVSASPTAWRCGLAAALCWIERPDEAREILDQAARDRFAHVVPNPVTLTALALYSDATALTRSAAAAPALYERMAPFSEQIVWLASLGFGHARLWLGLLAAVMGEHDRADEHLEFACRFHEENRLALWAARGHLGWAEALLARDDSLGAREHATRALELAREHAYGALEKRAAGLLAVRSAAEA